MELLVNMTSSSWTLTPSGIWGAMMEFRVMDGPGEIMRAAPIEDFEAWRERPVP